MTKRLPPPGGNGKLPSRRPPPGHPALAKDFFVRFAELTDVHDELVHNYKELKHVSGSSVVRVRMQMLEPCDDDEVFDKLEWLWPDVPDIYSPPRDHYAQRCSLLVGSFPSAAPHSPKVYTNQLVACVAVRAPSCMVLESACFELVTTYKYSNAPNIADLMALIDKHDKLWEERLRIDREVRSGRAREFAKRRLAYEQEQEQKKIDRTIARLEKLNQPEMIAELREGSIDVLDEEFEEKVSVLEREAREQAQIAEQKRKEADPNWIAIQAWLKQFELHQRHRVEFAETIYKAAIKEAKPIEAAIAKRGAIPPGVLDNINVGLALDYMRARDFIKKATFKTLQLHDEEQPRKEGTRIRF